MSVKFPTEVVIPFRKELRRNRYEKHDAEVSIHSDDHNTGGSRRHLAAGV